MRNTSLNTQLLWFDSPSNVREKRPTTLVTLLEFQVDEMVILDKLAKQLEIAHHWF